MRLGGVISGVDPFILNRRYQGITADIYSSTALLARVVPSSISGTKKVIVFFGDSLPANSIPTLYTVTQSKNYTLSIRDGAIYPTIDPVLGNNGGFSSPFLSSVCAPVGDNLITGLYSTNAIIAPHCMGNSTIGDWCAPGAFVGAGGALNKNIGVMALRLANVGFTPDAVIWHGGPNDTTLGTSQANYTTGLLSFIATCRGLWPTTPVLIGSCSKASGTPSAGIIAAQAAVIDHPNGVWAGVDSDSYAGGSFQDGTHLNATGRAAWASEAITKLAAAGAI